LMCDQYLQSREGGLDHLCMSAGEEAVGLLVAYGLVKPSARGGEWSEAGLALLRS
jgi:hypothetical protein